MIIKKKKIEILILIKLDVDVLGKLIYYII